MSEGTQRRLLGYVLSGARSSEASFEPIVDAEYYVREGMLVVIETGPGKRRLLGSIASIEAHHELLEPGSLWSESIRQKQLPPLQAARRYMVARTTIYGEIRSDGLGTVDKPPEPGAPVYEAVPQDLQPLYGYLPGKTLPPEIIEIGKLYGYTDRETDKKNMLPVSLNLEKLPMHFAVLGVTGSGKSNTMGVIIERLGKKDGVKIGSFEARTVPVIVFDANGDYLDYYKRPHLVHSYHVVRLVFSHAMKAPRDKPSELRELRIDLNTFRGAASELAEAIYAAVRGGSLEGLELQLDHLTRILSALEEADSGSTGVLHDIYYRCPAPGGKGVDLNQAFRSKDCVEKIVKLADEIEGHRATKAAVARTIRSFHDLVANRYDILAAPNTFRVDGAFIDRMTDPRRPMLVIVDFSPDGAPGVELRLKQFIVYYFSRLLLSKFTEYKTSRESETRVAMVVIEEAQNYIPNQREYPIGFSVARRYLALAATQGRKFGLSLALVTQRPGFVDPVALSMMNTFIIHRVASGDTRFVQIATGGLPRYIAARLPLLETGVAVITGQMSPFPYPVLARIDRRASHEAGSL